MRIQNNTMVKRAIAFLFLLFCLIESICADTRKSLIVECNNGTTVNFLLANLPELTFSNRSLVVKDNIQSFSFIIDNVLQYYFTSEETDITRVGSQPNIRFYYDTDGNVVVEGFDQPAQIRLFSVKGWDYSDCVSEINDKAVVSLSSLQKGVYIISINNQQIKVYKK